MGYYTSYNLEIVEGSSGLITELRRISDGAHISFDDNGDTISETQWYIRQQELTEFSEKHPEALFKLRGYGEENDDIWIEYYRNGKRQYSKATLSFDPCVI